MARMRIAPQERWRVKAACLRLLASLPLTAERRRTLGQFVDLYLPLSGNEQRSFQTALGTLSGAEQEAIMEFVTSWELKGRAEGQQELVLRLIVRKFSSLEPSLRDQVIALEPAQLQALAEALLDFSEPAELHTWLGAHSV